MKKLLGLLGAAGLVATTSATVVSCGNKASDVTLSESKLSKEFIVKTSKITADGTITFEIDKDSVLKVEVKAGSQKAGEVIIVVSTTADKIKDKEVKEIINVRHKAKDSTKNKEKVASVSVKIEAKKVSIGKVKLDTAIITLTATNDTTNEQVIKVLKEVKGLEKVAEITDVTITKVKATIAEKGSIEIKAVSSSKLVEGSKTLEIAQLPDSRVDLEKVTTSFKPTNDKTDTQVIDALKVVNGLSVLTADDVDITKIKAESGKKGKIEIVAKSTSTLVKGKLTLEIDAL